MDGAGSAVLNGLCAWASSTELSALPGARRVLDAGVLLGAVFGPVDESEAEWIVRRLLRHDDPGSEAVEVPWAAVVRREGGAIAAACSTMLPSGLFVATEGAVGDERFVVATDPGSALRARGVAARVDPEYLRAWVTREASASSTPYIGLRRIVAGQTVVWQPPDAGRLSSRTEIREWCGPDTLPPPTREGDRLVGEYIETFDAVVARLARRAGPLMATVSGGLDSTFVAASLVRADPEKPVQGYCHSPLPDAAIDPDSPRDADDLPLAELMAARYPGRLTITALRNTALVRPLDAAAAMSRRSWLPVMTPATRVWLELFQDRLRESGARLGFIGVHGNASFSFPHRYVSANSRSLLRLPTRLRTGTWQSARRSRAGRVEYLELLSARRTGFASSLSPAATDGILWADPFAARSIVELAASITPQAWRAWGHRGFARTAAAGRVPDGIRLRHRRGDQTSDVWHVIRHDRDEYLDRAAVVGEVPGLSAFGGRPLIEEIASWPWGEPLGPPRSSLSRVHGILALADFAVEAAARGRSLGAHAH